MFFCAEAPGDRKTTDAYLLDSEQQGASPGTSEVTGD